MTNTPVLNWRDFQTRVGELSNPDRRRSLLSAGMLKQYPEGQDFSINEVCKAMANQNDQYVWAAYETYLDACAYNTSPFQVIDGNLHVPLAASVHYGCGLLGRWRALSFRRQEEYFGYGEQGWSTLTRSSRKRFEMFYRNELPLRAHLASNPFLSRPALFCLQAKRDEGLPRNIAELKKLPQLHETSILFSDDPRTDANYFFVREEVCHSLHDWLTTSENVDDFLDGLEPERDYWLLTDCEDQYRKVLAIKRTTDNPEIGYQPLFDREEWERLISGIEETASGLIPNREHHDPADVQFLLEELARRAVALRTFVVAHYSALHLKIFSANNPGRVSVLNDVSAIMSCIYPLYTRPDSLGMVHTGAPGYEFCDFANYIGGYAIRKHRQKTNSVAKCLDRIDAQVRSLQGTISCLARVEQLALSQQRTGVSLVTENIIRECCVIDPEVLRHVNKWRPWFEKNLAPFRRPTGDTESDFVRNLTVEHKGMVGASAKITDLFERIQHHVQGRHVYDAGVCTEITFRSLFFYSEPGCGKENIAKVVHLLGQHDQGAPASYLGKFGWKRGKDLSTLIGENHALWENHWLRGWNDFDKGEAKVTIDCPREPHANMTVNMCGRPTNYFVLNCGEAKDREDLTGMLFGRFGDGTNQPERRSGMVLAAHLTGGTVFFDEFNTLAKHLDAIFLRFLEKPYRYTVRRGGETHSPNAELLAILASNKDRSQLIADGFNSAVVFRATENFFVIPPLRERKEDIAVFVLHQLLEHNKGRKPIHRISTEGMRLICEMHWEQNYRGVRAFLNILLENREVRGLTDSEISFKEVVEALQRMDALRSGPSSLLATRQVELVLRS